MNWKKLRALLVLLAIPGALMSQSKARAAGFPYPDEWLMPIHQLKIQGNPRFYGSAILFKVTADRAYFLTNAHVVSETASFSAQASSLRVEGSFTDRRSMPVRVVGRAVGFDLAVLELTLTKTLEPAAIQSIQSDLNELLPHQGSFDESVPDFHQPPEDLVDARHVGSPSFEEMDSGYTYFSPSSWGDFLKRILARGEPEKVPQIKAPATPRWIVSNDCPSPFLKTCYLTSIPSWGFSGGAHLAVQRSENGKFRAQIVGIPSHFKFLSPLTYVIPIETALRIGGDILLHGDLDGDRRDEPDFVLLNEGTILVRKGSLKGSVVTHARSEWIPAGGDLSGGGGDLSGGGGDLSGGGGDLSGGGGGRLGLPRNWFTRGFKSLIEYKPGVIVNGVRYQSALVSASKGGSARVVPLESTSQFVRAYRESPEMKLQREPIVSPLPARLVAEGLGMTVSVRSADTRFARRNELLTSIVQQAAWDQRSKTISLQKILFDPVSKKPVSQALLMAYSEADFASLSSESWEIKIPRMSLLLAEGVGSMQQVPGAAIARIDYQRETHRYLLRLFFRGTDPANAARINETMSLSFRSEERKQ